MTFVALIKYKSNLNWRQGTSVDKKKKKKKKNRKKNNSSVEGSDLNIMSWVLLTFTRVNTMKRRKDVNQGGHLRDFKLCICLNGAGVSSEITSPASCLCKQLGLQEATGADSLRPQHGTCRWIIRGSGPQVSVSSVCIAWCGWRPFRLPPFFWGVRECR